MSKNPTKCHNCQQVMTKKLVAKAIDAEQHIGEYGTGDDERVWITTDGKAICHTHDTEHYTTKEWTSAQ
jgi:hypothetical protein